MKDSRLIALDFDGVLIDHPPNITFDEILTYPPMKDSVKVLNYLVDQGIEFYVLTARHGKEIDGIKRWLKRNGFPEMRVTNKKTNAVIYLDDRGYRFTNWTDFSKLLC